MADSKTYVILSDGATYDEADVSRVVVISDPKVLDGINLGVYEDADEFVEQADADYSPTDLLRIAEDASEYIRAVTRGQLLQWIAESGATLVNDLTAAGFLTVENAADYFGQFDD